MIKAIFFDVDGTLCDPGDSWTLGVSAAFDLFASAYPAERAAFEQAWKQTNSALLEELASGGCLMRDVIRRRFPESLARIGIDNPDLARRLNDRLSETRRDALRPMPGVHEVLAALRSDYHLGIITNGSDADYVDSQPSTIRQIGVQDQVDAVWISDTVGCRKPDSRIFTTALNAAAVSPAEAVFVGDSHVHDIAGANSAGMTSILIDPAAAFDPASSRIIPDRVIRSLRELIPLFREPGQLPDS